MIKNNSYSKASLVTFLVLLFLVLGFSFQMVRQYLLALVMGGMLALLCQPLYRKLSGAKGKFRSASTIVTLVLLLAIVGPLSALVILGVKEGIHFARFVSQSETLSFQFITDYLAHLPLLHQFVEDPSGLEEKIRNFIQTGAKQMLGMALGFAGKIPNLALQFVLSVIACFYFLIEGDRFVNWIFQKIPIDPEIREKIFTTLINTTSSVVWATLAAASAQSVLMVIGFLVLGIPAIFLAGAATFVFAWIPLVGSSPVWLAGSIYLLIQGTSTKAIILILIGMLTGVVDNIIRPLVLKGRSAMHPLVSLVAVFGGIRMMGLFGVFIGPLVLAILVSLLEMWPMIAKKYGVMEK